VNAAKISEHFRGQRAGDNQYLVRCPCLHHGKGRGDKHPSLSISDGEDGRLLVNCHAGCTYEEIIAAFHRLGLINSRQRHPHVQPARQILRTAPSRGLHETDNRRNALRIWQEAGPIEKSLAAMFYLKTERGISELPSDLNEALRVHPQCPFGRDERGAVIRHHAIVALLRDVLTNVPAGIHRIAITPSGTKIDRWALGEKKGAACKLWEDAEITTGLVIGEGIETVLAAATVEHKGTLLRPAWACIDKENLTNFPVLPGVEYLTILADHDASGAGQSAARSCARRWQQAGHEAEVLLPNVVGEDFNDIAKDISAQKI
jgi:Toprim domain